MDSMINYASASQNPSAYQVWQLLIGGDAGSYTLVADRSGIMLWDNDESAEAWRLKAIS